MRCWKIVAMMLLLGCKPPPPDGGTAQEVPPNICSGQVQYSGDGEYGSLLCDDFCSDGTRCREMMNEAEDRAWCGCPGEPEPALCHTVRVKAEDEWEAACSGGCPRGGNESCRKDRREEDSDGGVISCECLDRDD